jgi:hypothetical protein
MYDLGFKCAICGKAVGDSYVCLDRRTESIATSEQDGKVTTTINIADCQSLVIYCGTACWELHEPVVEAELKVHRAFPGKAALIFRKK